MHRTAVLNFITNAELHQKGRVLQLPSVSSDMVKQHYSDTRSSGHGMSRAASLLHVLTMGCRKAICTSKPCPEAAHSIVPPQLQSRHTVCVQASAASGEGTWRSSACPRKCGLS